MAPTTGGFLAVCLLLAGAGLIKLWRPAAATRALMDLDIPGWNVLAGFPVARLLGLSEVVLAAGSIWWGGRWSAGVVALAYLAFAAVAGRLVTTADSSGCGCLGDTRSPLTGVHVAIDVIFAAVAAAGLIWPPTGAQDWFHAGPAATVLTAGAGAVLAGLGYLLFTSFPALRRHRAALEAG